MQVTIHEAKTHLSRLLHKVEEGEEIVLCRGKNPVARLVPAVIPIKKRPRVGVTTSLPFQPSEDAFFPLSEEELKTWGMV